MAPAHRDHEDRRVACWCGTYTRSDYEQLDLPFVDRPRRLPARRARSIGDYPLISPFRQVEIEVVMRRSWAF